MWAPGIHEWNCLTRIMFPFHYALSFLSPTQRQIAAMNGIKDVIWWQNYISSADSGKTSAYQTKVRRKAMFQVSYLLELCYNCMICHKYHFHFWESTKSQMNMEIIYYNVQIFSWHCQFIIFLRLISYKFIKQRKEHTRTEVDTSQLNQETFPYLII